MKVGDSSPIFIRLYCIRKSNDQGDTITNRGYRAYGNYRTGGTLPTDHQFTGQKQDRVPAGRGLIYMNACLRPRLLETARVGQF